MNYIIIAILIIIMIKECLDKHRLIIATKKRADEITIITCTETFIVILTMIFAKDWIHYLFGVLIFGILIIELMKQGFTDEGILISYKGKVLYKFDELKRAEIILNYDTIDVIYYIKDDVRIAKHEFDKIHLYKIISKFKSNNLTFSYRE